MDGLGLVPVIMGLFGISEVLLNVERRGEKGEKQEIFAAPTKGFSQPARTGASRPCRFCEDRSWDSSWVFFRAPAPSSLPLPRTPLKRGVQIP